MKTVFTVLGSVGLSIVAMIGILVAQPQWLFETATNATALMTGTPAAITKTEATSIPDVVAAAAPAVVSVVISADVPVIERYYQEYNPFGGWGWGGFSVPMERQIGTERQAVGGGTGFFVSADGYIITNRHVVDTDNASYSVVTNDGVSYEATVVAKDPLLDIAVLKVVSADDTFPFLTFGDATDLRLGETTIAIGNALAEFPNSISVGVVSGLSRTITASNGRGLSEVLEGVIQTDAAINQGNSGGPLLNDRGEVIGVNVAMANGSENIGFALPANVVAQVYQSVAEHGEIIRPFLGVRTVQITETIAAERGLGVTYGALIQSGEGPDTVAVMPDSAAAKAGLQAGDIILEINNTKLDGSRSLSGLLRDYGVGDTITLRIMRNGKEQAVDVILEAAPVI